uniref:Uncharacterized protein n=1 Tax=Lepeophtheirus salmonis TaxID=72036 RepID=A0A0K2U0L4_LEPSM
MIIISYSYVLPLVYESQRTSLTQKFVVCCPFSFSLDTSCLVHNLLLLINKQSND